MKRERLLKDNSARIPFSAIGILLILISIMTFVYLTKMDIEASKSLTSNIEISEADNAILYAQADLARAVNYAGMEALQRVGESPVMNGFSGEYNASGGTTSEPFNKNWARGMMRSTLNGFIGANYMHDAFVYGTYAVNVEKLNDWKNITLNPIEMSLNRTLNTPVWTPRNKFYAYFEAEVPLNISLKKLGGSEILRKEVKIKTLITTRYPFLQNITDYFADVRLYSWGAVMQESTVFSLAYVWAKGYYQYITFGSTGVKDVFGNENNKDVEKIVNLALILDEAFVFNSVDPMSLVDMGRASLGAKTSGGSIQMESVRAQANSEAANASGANETQKQQFEEMMKKPKAAIDFVRCPLSESASIQIGSSEACDIDNDSDIEKAPCGLCNSKETLSNISKIGYSSKGTDSTLSDEGAYSAFVKTVVTRTASVNEPGCPSGYNPKSTSAWSESGRTQTKTYTRDGYTLGGEEWEVNLARTHTCEKCVTLCSGTTCTTSCSRPSHTDTRKDVVTIKFVADWSSKYFLSTPSLDAFPDEDTKDDVSGVFTSTTYEGNADPNLNKALENYKSCVSREKFVCTTYDSVKSDIVWSNSAQSGYASGTYHQQVVLAVGTVPAWVNTMAMEALKSIASQLANITTSEGVTLENYPVPQDYIEAVRADLTAKIEANATSLVSKETYMSGGKYKSAGAKVVSLAREWFVDDVKGRINASSAEAGDDMDTQFDEIVSKAGEGARGKINDALRNGKDFLKEAISIPIGAEMRLQSEGYTYNWNESITLAVDMEPNYLSTDYSEKWKTYPMSIMTMSLPPGLGFVKNGGLPILPIYMPWICTFNIWVVHVKGKIGKFTVSDVGGESIPSPVFGEEAQVYVREDVPVRDPYDQSMILGQNQRITFEFWTAIPIVVPPGPQGVGDTFGKITETVGDW
jgi:hypothetical protein